jgi:hypothetical protein
MDWSWRRGADGWPVHKVDQAVRPIAGQHADPR